MPGPFVIVCSDEEVYVLREVSATSDPSVDSHLVHIWLNSDSED